MPVYEYGCKKCGKKHEILQKMSEAPKTECPGCGGEMNKLISNSSFVLKGSGWYATDYSATKKMEQHKPGKPVNTETTINNTEVTPAAKTEASAASAKEAAAK
jgi:putative FmdB family regulatory protein